MTYYKISKDQEQDEIRVICHLITKEIKDYYEDSFSLSDLVFKTGRSPEKIRKIIEVDMPKLGYQFIWEASPDMCEPDLDEEIQISDNHIRIYARLRGI